MQMVTWNTPEWRLLNGICTQPEVPGYSSYVSMLARCQNPKAHNYHLYGGRGIKVCPRWDGSFANFIADMGPRPGEEYSVDRIDHNGDYTPDNCRWATSTEQARNRRNNHLLTAFGETKPISAWVADSRCAVSKGMLRYRVVHGWDVETAITKSPAPSYRLVRLNDGAGICTN